MKTLSILIAAATLFASSLLFSACSHPDVQNTRQAGINNRQDRIDARSSGRNARWAERGEREDARSEARFNSW
jgi:hypothetical protein